MKLTLSNVVVTLCATAIVLSSCNDHPKVVKQAITPQPFPDSAVTGIQFPTDSAKIYQWLNNYDTASIAKHAWGVWAGLTAKTNQVLGGDTLLVYETWLGTSELQTMMKEGIKTITKFNRTPLSRPTQLHHATSRLLLQGKQVAIDTAGLANQWVTVNYSPDAATYALAHDIFNMSILTPYLKSNKGSGSIPAFPNSSLTLKPTYLYVSNNGTERIAIPVWPGLPSPPDSIPSFEEYWQYVFVDVTNTKGVKIPKPVVSANETDSTLVNNATVNLRDFIHFTIDSVMANYLNKQQAKIQGVNAQAGDLALLVGMHVTTKEISNWTWQTYFWVPDPANPPLPSSSFNYQQLVNSNIKLSHAASHYAALPAYNMVWPNQPISGGTNKGATPQFGFNPYLEASFGPSTFPQQNMLNSKFIYGVQSNCMSCHAMATFTKNNATTLPYITDQYVSMNDTAFNTYVKLDFAWSIQASAYADSTKVKHK